MIEMLKRHETQVLRRAGHTWAQVAALSGVSVGTARRVAAEEAVATVDNVAERARRRIGRPSTADAYREGLLRALTEDPSLRSVELLHRARLQGYAGGKSALYALAQTLRTRPITPLVRFEGLPGEFSQHDFGEVCVAYQDGTEEKIHFFASRLKYSRWVEVTLVRDERADTLVRVLVEHLTAFGGIPLVAVFDRPKTIALKWGRDGVVTEWNPTFAGVTLDLGIGVDVCWPYRPQEKGSVENLVGWVKKLFLQAAPLSRPRGSRAAAARLAHRRASHAAVESHGCPAGGAHCRGSRAPAPAEGRAGRPRTPDSSERLADRRGDTRWASVLDAARGDRLARHVVSVSRPRADHRRPL